MVVAKEVMNKTHVAGVNPRDFRPSLLRVPSQRVKDVPEDYKSPSLRRWRVVEVVSPNGIRSRHVYGHDVANDAGRASSAIKEFDWETMTVTTQSGRNYKLVGAPGNARSGEYAWRNWCNNNVIVSELDVTDEYFSIDKLFPQNGAPEPE
jgi:hypothetical protein